VNICLSKIESGLQTHHGMMLLQWSALTLCTKAHVPINHMGVRSMTYKEDDILVDEYLGKVDDDQLYTVAYIIDERRQGNKREFRVKWEVRRSRAQMPCSP